MVMTEPTGNAGAWISVFDKRRPDVVCERFCVFRSWFIAGHLTKCADFAEVDVIDVERREKELVDPRQGFFVRSDKFEMIFLNNGLDRSDAHF